MSRKLKRLLAAVAAMFFNTHDVRNDLARFLDHEPIADPQTEPFDFVAVVQARSRNFRAGDLDRSEMRDRS